MTNEEPPLVSTVLNRLERTETRAEAAARLGRSDTERAIEILLRVTEDNQESEDMLRRAGEELGRISIRTRPLTEFEMRDMAGTAYDAYCDVVE